MVQISFTMLCWMFHLSGWMWHQASAFTSNAWVVRHPSAELFQSMLRLSDSSLIKARREFDDDDGDLVNSMDITQLEKRVYYDTRERLDLQALSILPTEEDANDLEIFDDISNPFKVAIAAGGLSFLASLYFFQNMILSLVCFGLVAAFASWDPLDEQSTAGAFSRVVGRGLIRVTKKTQPRINAVAAAVVKGDAEIKELRKRIEDLEDEVATLEEENSELRKTLEMQYAIERALGKFSLDQLRYFAQKNGIPSSGTKSQLLKRLVESEIVDL